MNFTETDDQITLKRTLKTAKLIDGFWDRWIAHGIDQKDIQAVRSSLTTIETWVTLWRDLAEEKLSQATKLKQTNHIPEAEELFRKASLYFNLLQWMFPDSDEQKLHWYERSHHCIREADLLSSVKTDYVKIRIDNHDYYGRVRIPLNADGCIIIIPPIDSSRDELYSYEMDFINRGMMTVCFDGPGQGETLIRGRCKGNQRRTQTFVDEVVNYTSQITQLPIFLFGTSSGASWTVYGSSLSKVNKVVAVSPTDMRARLSLPSYFKGRLAFLLNEFEIIANYEVTFHCPVLIFHGEKDGMSPHSFVPDLFYRLPEGKKLVVFEDEGHCCNFKLAQIRSDSVNWFRENICQN